jgi:hypothetical protein
VRIDVLADYVNHPSVSDKCPYLSGAERYVALSRELPRAKWRHISDQNIIVKIKHMSQPHFASEELLNHLTERILPAMDRDDPEEITLIIKTYPRYRGP